MRPTDLLALRLGLTRRIVDPSPRIRLYLTADGLLTAQGRAIARGPAQYAHACVQCQGAVLRSYTQPAGDEICADCLNSIRRTGHDRARRWREQGTPDIFPTGI